MKIDFEFDTQYGIFRDALYLPDNHQLTSDQINAMQLERVNNWLEIIDNPPVPEAEFIEIENTQYEKITFNGQILLKPIGT